MKKFLSILLITLLVLPAFISWLPHGVIHALHGNNIEHYFAGSHGHSNDEHVHNDKAHDHHLHGNENLINANHLNHRHSQLSDHHSIYFDLTAYYSDYLNVDLQRISKTSVDSSGFDLYDIDTIIVVNIKPHHHYDLPPSKTRIPIDWQLSGANDTPPYLSTQRLRI